MTAPVQPTRSTTVYVDADACPVRAEIERAVDRTGVSARLVTDGGLRPAAHPRIETIYVDPAPDAADRWIEAHAGPGDVVVTADILLAAACIGRGASVVKPDGTRLTEENVGAARAARDLAADLRAADPFRQGTGRPFDRADRARFADALDRAIRAAGSRDRQ